MAKKHDVLDFWWAHLLAVPESYKSESWRRLWRVWFDHTMKHWFFGPKTEAHRVATLFENFVILPPSWVKELVQVSGLTLKVGDVATVRWAYEVPGKSKSGHERLADVAVCFRDEEGDAVLLVEAKVKGGRLKNSDLNPESYLDHDSFSSTNRRALIYLLDEADRASAKKRIKDPQGVSTILSWQRLAGLQIHLVKELDVDPRFRNFIAGSIQYQYAQHGIWPTELSALYLESEWKKGEINSENPEKMNKWKWCCFDPW